MNALPKNYYFQNNIKHPKKDIVKERFNKTYNQTMFFSDNDYYSCIEGEPGCYSTKRSFENKDAIEITINQFLEMTEPRKTWTLEEFREAKVAIKWSKKDDLNLLRKIADAEMIMGVSKYYWKNPKIGHYTLNGDHNNSGLPTCSINDIIFPDKQTNMNKKLLGYKPKATTKIEWVQVVVNLPGLSFETGSPFFSLESIIEDKLENAGVLDIWFDKVYEEEKKIFTLDCEDGSFELEVSKEGIYYKPDNTYLDDTYLTGVVNFSTNSVLEGSNSKKYKCSYSYVNLGCKKHIPILQLKEVVDYYELLNK